jgi:hypothetical protein
MKEYSRDRYRAAQRKRSNYSARGSGGRRGGGQGRGQASPGVLPPDSASEDDSVDALEEDEAADGADLMQLLADAQHVSQGLRGRQVTMLGVLLQDPKPFDLESASDDTVRLTFVREQKQS